MTSIRCPQCSLLHWDTDTKCKRCGTSFRSASEIPQGDVTPIEDVGAQNAVRPAPWVAQQRSEPAFSGKKKIGLAVFSLVTGIMCVPPLFSFVVLIIGGLLA